MPIYSYVCKCGIGVEDVRSMASPEPIMRCPECGGLLRRDYQRDRANPRGKDYGSPIVSHSLAMHPDQIREHKQMFPDIAVTSDGCPTFYNTQEHDKYLKASGWRKNPGKRRRRSKKLPCGAGNQG